MLSIPHLIIIFVIVLIAVGPEKMPQLARTLGKAMAEFRKITGDLRRVVDDEMRELDRQTREAEIRKRDASAQSSLPGASTPAVQMLGTPLPDEHVIAPPVDADSGSIAEPQPEHSIAPPGTIATAPPNARSAEADAAEAQSEPVHENPPSDAQSKPA